MDAGGNQARGPEDGPGRAVGGRRRPSGVGAVALAVAVLAGLAGAGCGDGAPEGDGTAPRQGGTAVVGVSSGATTLLPPLARTALDGELSSLLYPGLSRAEWQEDGGGLDFTDDHPLSLSRGWRFGPDSTSLTYSLRRDLTWSDGEPLTAGDVVFTYGLLSDPEAGLPLSYVTRHMDSVTAAGDTAVTFHFGRRYPGMLLDSSVGILPEHVFRGVPPDDLGRVSAAGRGSGGAEEGAGAGPSATGGGLAVSGPFQVAEWRRGDRIVLVRNPRSTVIPRLDTLVFRVVPEEATRLAELRSGGLDLAQLVSFREAGRLEEQEGYRMLRQRRRAYDYIAWNPDGHPAFADVRVREALSRAVDREAILASLEMEGYAEPAAGPYGPLFPSLRVDPGLTRHSPERARRLLREAGWTAAGGNGGVRARDGTELSFRLVTEAGSDRRTAAAELIRAQLEEVGVEARVRTQEFNSLFGRVRSGEYEAALLGWQVGLDPDISPFWYEPASPLNVVGYGSQRVRALIDSAQAAPTARAAEPHWRRVARNVARDYPYAFLWHFDLLYAAGSRLRGVGVDPAGFTRNAHQWWVAPGGGR